MKHHNFHRIVANTAITLGVLLTGCGSSDPATPATGGEVIAGMSYEDVLDKCGEPNKKATMMHGERFTPTPEDFPPEYHAMRSARLIKTTYYYDDVYIFFNVLGKVIHVLPRKEHDEISQAGKFINAEGMKLKHDLEELLKSHKSKQNKMADDRIPRVLAGFSSGEAFGLKKGKKYELYRFKSILQVTAVTYFRDGDGKIVSKAIPLMSLADSAVHFFETIMIQVDYCPTQFESLDDARRAVLENKAVWIEDLIRQPSTFDGAIKAIK